MKVLLINTYGHAGAAKACIRLHTGLLARGVESRLLLLEKKEEEKLPATAVFDRRLPGAKADFTPGALQRLLKGYPSAQRERELQAEINRKIPKEIEWFSYAHTGFDLAAHPWYQEADLINLHWTSGFVDYSFFRKNKKPVAWTLHDMNAFTGGCHYSGTCTGYTNGCHRCPQLETTSDPCYSSVIFRQKEQELRNSRLPEIVALSQWMKTCSEASRLFSPARHHLIPNGLDTSVFRPTDRAAARTALGLPQDKKVILFVAYASLHSRRKGYDLLQQAFQMLNSTDVVLCAVGNKQRTDIPNQQVIDAGFVQEEQRLALLYSAADFFVLPSREDNLPNTAVESVLCGTPVVAFKVGGVQDIVLPDLNGMLVDELTAEALAAKIRLMLESLYLFDREKIRENALARYSQEVQASAYIRLFHELLNITRN